MNPELAPHDAVVVPLGSTGKGDGKGVVASAPSVPGPAPSPPELEHDPVAVPLGSTGKGSGKGAGADPDPIPDPVAVPLGSTGKGVGKGGLDELDTSIAAYRSRAGSGDHDPRARSSTQRAPSPPSSTSSEEEEDAWADVYDVFYSSRTTMICFQTWGGGGREGALGGFAMNTNG